MIEWSQSYPLMVNEDLRQERKGQICHLMNQLIPKPISLCLSVSSVEVPSCTPFSDSNSIYCRTPMDWVVSNMVMDILTLSKLRTNLHRTFTTRQAFRVTRMQSTESLSDFRSEFYNLLGHYSKPFVHHDCDFMNILEASLERLTKLPPHLQAPISPTESCKSGYILRHVRHIITINLTYKYVDGKQYLLIQEQSRWLKTYDMILGLGVLISDSLSQYEKHQENVANAD